MSFYLDHRYADDSRPKAEDLFQRTVDVVLSSSAATTPGQRMIATSVDYTDESDKIPDLVLTKILPEEQLKIDLATWAAKPSGLGLLSRFVTQEAVNADDVTPKAQWINSQNFNRWFPYFSAEIKNYTWLNPLAADEVCQALAKLHKADAVTLCINFDNTPNRYSIEPNEQRNVKIDGIYVWNKDTPFRKLARRANGIVTQIKQKLLPHP